MLSQVIPKLQEWFMQNRITAFVVVMHFLLIVGIQLSPDRPKTGANMGDTVTASLLDPNPQKEKAKVSQPVPEKPKAPEKKTVEPVVTTSTPSSLTSTQTQDSSTAKPTSTGGSSTGEPKSISLSQAQCSVPEPIYPSLSRRMGEEGKILVRLFIGEDGAVQKVNIAQSSGLPRLDQAALDAGMKVRCRPFLELGKPIKVTAIQPYIFRLE